MGSRIQLAALQEDEEIIAVVDDHMAESVPAYIQRFLKERLVLSSDGNISLWSKHRWDESHLLKFWNVRDIESITKTDKQITSPFKFWTFMSIVLIAGLICWYDFIVTVLTIIIEFDAFSSGKIQFSIQDEVSSTPGFGMAFVHDIWLVLITLVLIPIPLVATFRAHNWCLRNSIEIEFKEGYR